VDDPIANEWKLKKIEVGPRYTVNEIYHKVRSRWKDRWKIDWDEELMYPWESWGQEGRLDRNQIREWIDGERIMLLVQQKGGSLIEEMMNEEEFWDKFLCGRKWKKKVWLEWIKNNPEWEQSWKEPESWLPGEKQWSEELDSWEEKIRRHNEEWREFNRALWEKNKDFWARVNEEMKAEEEAKRLRRIRRKREEEERWAAYCARQLEKLKELNRKESDSELRWKEYCED
jgi:hypothetical protein